MFDYGNKGYLEYKEFADVMRAFDRSLQQDDVEYLFRKFDVYGNGKVPKAEFNKHFYDQNFGVYDEGRAVRLLDDLKASLMGYDKMQINQFYANTDRMGSGFVSYKDFEVFVRNVDRNMGPDEATTIFRYLDPSKSGMIKYQEFIKIFSDKTTGGDVSVDQQLIDAAQLSAVYFEELGFLLELENSRFEDTFYSTNGYNTKLDIKKKFERLGLVISQEPFERMMDPLIDRNDRDRRISLKNMKECIVYFTNNPTKDKEVFEKHHLDIVRSEINEAINKLHTSFDSVFGVLDRFKDGVAQKIEVENAMYDKLHLKKSSNKVLLFKNISNERAQVNIKKFKEFLNEAGGGTSWEQQEAKKVIDHIRSQITLMRMDPESVFKRFDQSGDGELDLKEFDDGIHYMEPNLRKDQIKSIFDSLDVQKKGSISKYQFLRTFANISSHQLPDFLMDTCYDFFADFNEETKTKASDLHNILGEERGIFRTEKFKSSLWLLLGPEKVRKYDKEIARIVEVLQEDRTEGMSYEGFVSCLRRAREPRPTTIRITLGP
jgi:Ca2+-binding EF-hand superfamily protein